jgi:hypothetical protein
VPISKKNREFFETLGNIQAIKRDLATGSGEALGFGPRRRAEAMLWVREKDARARQVQRWKSRGVLIGGILAAVLVAVLAIMAGLTHWF